MIRDSRTHSVLRKSRLRSTLFPRRSRQEDGGGNISLVYVGDDAVLDVIKKHGITVGPLGMDSDAAINIRTFNDWFVGNQEIRIVDITSLENLEDIDLRGTCASLRFGAQIADYGISSLMLDEDDPDGNVSQEEIEEYLNSL